MARTIFTPARKKRLLAQQGTISAEAGSMQTRQTRGMDSLQHAVGNQAVNLALQPSPSESTREVLETPPELQNALLLKNNGLDLSSTHLTAANLGGNTELARIHTGESAQAAADSINARAFTVGRDIFFGKNQYNPTTGAGLELLGHELSHVVEQNSGGSQAAGLGTGAMVQRKAYSKAELEEKYGITIKSGNQDWSESEIEELSWALSMLSKSEAAALVGYQFLRWKDPKSRQEVDLTYDRKGEEESGLHEFDNIKEKFKISLYDSAFDPATTVQLTIKDQPIGEKLPISRMHILHEIGHAMQHSGNRQVGDAYKKASSEHRDLMKKYDEAPPDEQKKMLPKANIAGQRKDALGKKVGNERDRVLKEFKALTKDMKPLTSYAEKNPDEAFAETYALYKMNPAGIEKINKKLAKWFKQQAYLLDGK